MATSLLEIQVLQISMGDGKAANVTARSLLQQYLLSLKIPPHKFLHDFLHPHLQAYEADAVAPPQPEQVE